MRIRTASWKLASLPVSLAVLAVITGMGWGWQQISAPASPTFTVQRFRDLDEGRERYQRATDILKALSVSGRDWVADVGAGNGYYSQRLSELVGPDGKVFAEEISDYFIDFLDHRVKLFDLHNVEVVKGDVDNPKLPAVSLSAVLLVDTYHHLTEYRPMSEQIIRALKPGGRLVIADYSLSEHRDQPRAEQLKIHEIDPRLVQRELEQVGFQVVRCEDPFLKRIPDAKNSSTSRADMWLMIAVRPK